MFLIFHVAAFIFLMERFIYNILDCYKKKTFMVVGSKQWNPL